MNKRNDEWHWIIFYVIGKKKNQTSVSDADREITTLGSTDNAGNSVNLVSGIFPFTIEISLSGSETDDKSRKENPQKLTQLSSRSHPRHLVGKKTAQKDITIDTTSDSQVNSNFPNRWSPASLTFNNYFYLFLYLYITWITTNNNAPHLKSPKNQKQKSRLGTASNKKYWGGGGGGGASTSFRSTNPRP